MLRVNFTSGSWLKGSLKGFESAMRDTGEDNVPRYDGELLAFSKVEDVGSLFCLELNVGRELRRETEGCFVCE